MTSAGATPIEPTAPPSPLRGRRAAVVAPRFRHDPDWPWVTGLPPMDELDVERHVIRNLLEPLPKATRPYRAWQYARTVLALRRVDVAFYFSTDVAIGCTRWPAPLVRQPVRVYCGFTQDGPRSPRRIAKVSRALRRMDAVTTFCEEEREVYRDRYDLDPARFHVVPIHTDETGDYGQYPDVPPRDAPYALALGSPNRRFAPTVEACRALDVPLVIITRPWHAEDDLDALAGRGAEIITDADKMKALTYLKHARLAIMPFKDPSIAGGYTTLVHAMFLRTPFVATRALGVAEHVLHDETGLVAPHGDDDALRAAIERLWSDPGLAARFGERAWHRAHERHSMAAAARCFHDLAARVVGAATR